MLTRVFPSTATRWALLRTSVYRMRKAKRLGSVEVGDTVIMFERADPNESARENRGARSGINLTICFPETHDLDALCSELCSEGVPMVCDIGDRPWGNGASLYATPMDIN